MLKSPTVAYNFLWFYLSNAQTNDFLESTATLHVHKQVHKKF